MTKRDIAAQIFLVLLVKCDPETCDAKTIERMVSVAATTTNKLAKETGDYT